MFPQFNFNEWFKFEVKLSSCDDINLLTSVFMHCAFRISLDGLTKERLLIVYQACPTCIRNTYCLAKDYM